MTNTITTAPEKEQQPNDLNTPWTVRHDDDDYWCVVNASGVVILARTGPAAEATAKLFATAPKLLAALIACSDELRGMTQYLEECRQEEETQAHHVLGLADAAIAQATDDSIGRVA